MNRTELLDCLLDFGEREELLRSEDRVYALNRILAYLGLNGPAENPDIDIELDTDLPAPARYLEPLLDDAAARGWIEDYTAERDLLDSRIMDAVMPRPSSVIDRFHALSAHSMEEATDWYYKLSQDSHYIRRDRIRKDKRWKHHTDYGELDITINLSKPEKDPREIAAARSAKDSGYPLCPLCREAEGYDGRGDYPGRAHHRIIPVSLQNTPFYLQYSPYVYYNEHSIVLNEAHVPMAINRDTFARLVSFVRQYPHYFVGSNADLPIVGGSILSHDHFQGGRYRFAMEDASDIANFTLEDYPTVSLSILNWPMSVLRLKSAGGDEQQLLDLAAHILETWRNYSDPDAEILHMTGETPHNTVTPICRQKDSALELDLVLRNNRTSDEHPLGIFHPHTDRHHIKKENIGLIEVMGLAVLPARLLGELDASADSILNGSDPAEDPRTEMHAAWLMQLKDQGRFSAGAGKEELLEELYQAVGDVFCKVLEDAGVYKQTPEGIHAFRRFIDSL